MHLHKIRYGGSRSCYLCTTTTFYARVTIPKLKDKLCSLSLSCTQSVATNDELHRFLSFQCHPIFFVLFGNM